MWLLIVWTQKKRTRYLYDFWEILSANHYCLGLRDSADEIGHWTPKNASEKDRLGKWLNWKRKDNSQGGWRASEKYSMICRIVSGSWNVIKEHLAFAHLDPRAVRLSDSFAPPTSSLLLETLISSLYPGWVE